MSEGHTWRMDHVEKCTSVLRPLILKGETDGIPSAENALNELMNVTPKAGQKTALHDVRTVVQAHREEAFGLQLGFADTVNNYIEKLMRALE
jgi:hypothetical protein